MRIGRCLTLFWGAWLIPFAAFGQDAGDTVVVVRDAEIKVAEKVMQTVPRGTALKVQETRGDLLLVASESTGWILKERVTLLPNAVDAFTDQIEKDPKDAGARTARGMVWFRRGEIEIALGDFSDAIRLNPKGFDGYNNRGLCWTAKGEYEKALDDFNESIRLNSKSPNGFNNRGQLWIAKGDPDRATSDFTEALRLNPKSPVTYANRASAWYEKRRYDKALADCGEAIRLDPQYVAAYVNRAMVYAGCPDADYRNGPQAIQNAETACAITGWKSANALGALAAAYAESGEFGAAIKWQTKADELYTDSQRKKYGHLIELYKNGKPYRREPKQ